MNPFSWTPSSGLNDTSSFPAKDTSFRAHMQALLDQVKDFINNNLVTHVNEKVSETIFATRNAATGGTQTITGLSGTPKRIEVRVYITDASSLRNSTGSWELGNNTQSCITVYRTVGGSIISGGSNTNVAALMSNESNYAVGTIQNVQNGQFDIAWSTTGAPTGTCSLQIVAHYH